MGCWVSARACSSTSRASRIQVKPGGSPPAAKWELAKDVASFATATGGLLVLGYRTVKPEHAVVEEASAVTFIPKQLIDAEA